MIDARITSATELLRKVRDYTTQLNEILSPEIISFEIIRGDLQRKREEMKTIEDQKAVLLIEIDHAKGTLQSTKEMAQEEAGKIIQAGKTVMVQKLTEVNDLLDKVKNFVLEADRKRYMQLRDDAEKAQKAIEAA